MRKVAANRKFLGFYFIPLPVIFIQENEFDSCPCVHCNWQYVETVTSEILLSDAFDAA